MTAAARVVDQDVGSCVRDQRFELRVVGDVDAVGEVGGDDGGATASRRRAITRPVPAAAPVTSATWPAIRIGLFCESDCSSSSAVRAIWRATCWRCSLLDWSSAERGGERADQPQWRAVRLVHLTDRRPSPMGRGSCCPGSSTTWARTKPRTPESLSDENRSDGKTAFVSGSTQGIGRAIAARLAACGAHAVVNGRDRRARRRGGRRAARRAAGRADRRRRRGRRHRRGRRGASFAALPDGRHPRQQPRDLRPEPLLEVDDDDVAALLGRQRDVRRSG